MTTGKTIALTKWAFVGKVTSLLFDMLSRLVIAFPPRSKCLLISWLQSQSAVILEPPKIKSATVFPSIFNEIMGLDVMIFVFWMLSLSQYFHSSLSLSSRGSLVLHFLPQDWCYLHIWGYWYFSRQSWFHFVFLPVQRPRRHIKSRHITLPTKVHIGKAMVFPLVMYGCESWTIKKADCWRTDAFELWCWRRLLRVPWTARSNQSILKEISPEYSLEGPMLKLKLQYFGHLMRRAYSLEKTLILGKIEDRRRRGQQRMRWLDGITNSMDRVLAGSRNWWRTGKSGILQSMGLQRVGHDWVTEMNWGGS